MEAANISCLNLVCQSIFFFCFYTWKSCWDLLLTINLIYTFCWYWMSLYWGGKNDNNEICLRFIIVLVEELKIYQLFNIFSINIYSPTPTEMFGARNNVFGVSNTCRLVFSVTINGTKCSCWVSETPLTGVGHIEHYCAGHMNFRIGVYIFRSNEVLKSYFL